MAQLIVPNQTRHENGKVYLVLSRDQIASVDEEDYPLIQGRRWSAVRTPQGCWYARTNVTTNKKQRGLLMHRFLLGLGIGDRRQVDHKDRNGLNNCRQNLRLANSVENNRNRSKRDGTTSRFRGVCWQKKYPAKPWQSSIRIDGRVKQFLGYFLTEREAAEAYNRAAISHHGEFACLNTFDD